MLCVEFARDCNSVLDCEGGLPFAFKFELLLVDVGSLTAANAGELPVKLRLFGPPAGDGTGEALGDIDVEEGLALPAVVASAPLAARAMLIASAVNPFSELAGSFFGLAVEGLGPVPDCHMPFTSLTRRSKYKATTPAAIKSRMNDQVTSLRFQPFFFGPSCFAACRTGSLESKKLPVTVSCRGSSSIRSRTETLPSVPLCFSLVCCMRDLLSMALASVVAVGH